jgi:deoxycytidine triphosphate deaminase
MRTDIRLAFGAARDHNRRFRAGIRMSIKSDHWIRRMAAGGMIEPFAAEQVRSVDGRKIISYGTSSYGYDVRCANEFKIFTNINSTIVDPKSFDPQSFVDVTAEVCIIPPNSFALARTVEYFRIPRSVLTVTVGKSTYARCFRGDTRVALVDGTAPTLEDMARRAEAGDRFFGYGIDAGGQLIAELLAAPRFIGRDALLEIRLDDGALIHTTPEHPFLTRTGRMVAAAELRPADALMPLYRQPWRGDQMVHQPLSGQRVPARRLAADWNLRHASDVDTRQARASGAKPDGDDRDAGRRSAAIGRAPPGRLRHAPSHAHRNHRVADVRSVPGVHDVYCLTAPETGNFALEAGVFVHNCGIIVNVTPLEPEWEGHVTLEFSNTTPLPAKIYAHEGVAQMLFLEADEVCGTSYRDRGGKYQGQRGVTLPKT